MNSIKEKIDKDGWIEIKGFNSNDELINVANQIGSIISHPDGNEINILNPKNSSESIKGTFSDKYEFNKFPLHTDTAFWAKPARYILMKSESFSDCDSLIIRTSDILNLMSNEDLINARKSIFLIKTINHRHYSSVLFKENGIEGFRYDPLCMNPINESAKKTKQRINEILNRIIPVNIKWNGENTIIIDNWKTLHGRSAIKLIKERKISRIYIN
jgi:hypothetical protein